MHRKFHIDLTDSRRGDRLDCGFCQGRAIKFTDARCLFVCVDLVLSPFVFSDVVNINLNQCVTAARRPALFQIHFSSHSMSGR